MQINMCMDKTNGNKYKCEDIKQPTKEEIEKLKAIKSKMVQNETVIRK